MSARRRVVGWLDHRIGRRILIAPLALIGALITVILSPVLIAVAAMIDVVTRQGRWRRLRLTILIIGALVIESIGILFSLVLWIVTGSNRVGPQRWRWHMHRPFMGLYTRTMLGLIVRVIGSSIQWRDNADLSSGPVVLLARHTSFFDALIPATVLSQRHRLLAHHVVTHGLRYAPCIDIVGHRFPNRFIKRTPGEGSSELVHITDVGRVLDDRSGAIIFPEGTFRNPERFTRQVRRIRRRDPELATRAEKLQHVLPPRANGTWALLQGSPDADVVVCANTGFETFGSIRDIVDQPFSDAPIVIETWRISRDEIPADEKAFSLWLFDEYAKVDTWVRSTKTENEHPL